MDVIQQNFYDFPKYYDLIFGADWKDEFRFLEAAFAKYARRPVKRLFEPACGTGRLLIKFAQAGYEVGGNDLNEHAVEFCNARLRRHGFADAACVGDMSNFKLKRKVDAAFNLINTVRHLPSDEAFESHLECVADSLVKGGLYLLGLHLTPATPQACTEECWTAAKGRLRVNSRLWTVGVDLKQRREDIGVEFEVVTPSQRFRIEDRTVFRTYTAEQMAHQILRVPKFEFLDAYDFTYDLTRPISIDRSTEDVVYVLRRR